MSNLRNLNGGINSHENIDCILRIFKEDSWQDEISFKSNDDTTVSSIKELIKKKFNVEEKKIHLFRPDGTEMQVGNLKENNIHSGYSIKVIYK